VGYVFARVWGQVGWIGPVSVVPAAQEHKIGRALMQLTIGALQKAGARVIGLETMPRNYRNLGFYGKLGFVPHQLTVDLHAPVSPTSMHEPLPENLEPIFWSTTTLSERAELAAALEQFTSRLDPFLSLTREVDLLRQYDYGDALLVRNESRAVVGCALAHTETYSTEEPRRYLKVNAVLLEAMLPLRPMLSQLHAWASREGLDSITVRTPTRYYLAYAELLRCGFRIFHADVRLTLQGYHEIALPEAFYLCKWE